MAEYCGGDAGGLVREYRQKAGLTQRQLAMAAGVSVGVVRDLEQGRTAHPRAESVRLLASALRLNQQQARELSLAARGDDHIAGTPDAPGRASDVQVGVLGPLAAWRRGVPVALGPPMQRAVLGLLALYTGAGLSRTAIIDALWGDYPPTTATPMVHSYISRLRHLLGPRPVGKSGNGYRLETAACELDLRTFDALVRHAGQAQVAGELITACQTYADALALWRGDPLADCEILRGHPAVVRLSQQKADAVIAYADAAIAARCPDRVLSQLRELADREPLNERVYALLMTALAGSGQQATALGIFDQVRRRLDKELGIRPGAELSSAQAHVLKQQIPVAPASSRVPAPAVKGAARAQPAGRAVPRELPAPVAHFVGRATELAALTDLLDRRDEQMPGTLVISAIGGTAGVGKTALAVHWAHRAAGRFPDGQLYVNLRGYDPDRPVAAADALAGLLSSLGVPGTDTPDGVEDRARLYRTRLAGRRMVVLLDNARDGDQVRPLLPGDAGCVAVVTSRDTLAGLVATDGAQRLDLDALPLADAVALLRSLIGARADDDPESVVALAGLCARLPLALRIAAELAVARPGMPLADLVAELAAGRLDCLNAGEVRADVRALFSWSFRQLPEDAAGAFALIGLQPGEDLDLYAVSALTGTSTGQARRVLGRLHRASLLQATGSDRYGLHDLLRAYAREQAAARDTEGQCQQALTRLFDFYLSGAAAAMDILFPAEAHRRPRVPPAAELTMPGEADARAWLDRERANLVAIVVHSARHGWPRHATWLAATLFRYLMDGSHLPEAHTIYDHALQAARRSGDLAAEAEALNGLGGIGMMKGHLRDAAGHYQAALERYRQRGDPAGQARVLQNLGTTEYHLHNHQSAADFYGQAIAAYDDAGDSLSAARALADLAAAETELGSYDQASGHLRHALQVLREAKDQPGEARALSWIGELSVQRGQLAEAAIFFEQSLTIFRRIDNPTSVANQLRSLGEVSLRQGEYQQASGYLRQALALNRETGQQHGEIMTLRDLAEALHGGGQPAAARTELAEALRLAAETGNTYQQASTHRDLAENYSCAGEDEQARHHWQQALTLYTQLGAPEADQIQSRLIQKAKALPSYLRIAWPTRPLPRLHVRSARQAVELEQLQPERFEPGDHAVHGSLVLEVTRQQRIRASRLSVERRERAQQLRSEMAANADLVVLMLLTGHTGSLLTSLD